MAEVEETLKKIHSHKGVKGVIIANSEGIVIRSTLEDRNPVHQVAAIHPLLMSAKKILHDLDPENEFVYLRLRTEKNETIVTADDNYFMIGIHKPSPEAAGAAASSPSSDPPLRPAASQF